MQKNRRMLGLKGKFLLIVLGPVLITFLILGLYSRFTMSSFGLKVTDKSTSIVTAMAEEAIIEKARSVAGQIGLALQMMPDLARQEFNDNPTIHKLAVQPVGSTGYTVLWSVPENGNNVSPTWVHPDQGLIGKDTPPLVKKRLGERYNEWFSVYQGCYHGQESQGYYLWEDDKGQQRQKFLACTPIPDTPYVISATTYLDEFLTPVKLVGYEISNQIQQIGLVHIVTMALGLIVCVLAVWFGIYKVSGQIVTLTKAIEDVSMGRVDDEITIIKSNDELQDLSEAFERMRTAVKFIMRKLEKKREKETTSAS